MKVLIGIYRTVRNLLPGEAEAIAVMQETLSAGAREDLALYRRAIELALQRLPASSRAADALLPRFDPAGRLIWPGALDEALAGRSDLIRGALDRLDGLDRAAFVLREIEGLSLEDAAAVLQLSTGAIRQRTHRARLVVIGALARSCDQNGAAPGGGAGSQIDAR